MQVTNLKTVQNNNQKLKTGLLGITGLLLLSFPFVSIPNKPQMVGSVPVLYVYIFGVWVLLIAGVLIVSERSGRKPKNRRNE